MIWHCGKFEFDTSTPTIMGVLNLTPDSFSDGAQFQDLDAAMAHAKEMLKSGALIIDVGGESTRPGAEPVSPDEEWSRIAKVVSALAEEGVCVSVDTRHAEVAEKAVAAGASIINDVSGFRDPAMVEVAKSCDAGLVVMHMKGDPSNMQDDPQYDDVVAEVCEYLSARASELEAEGIAANRICLDPGPGFGKTYKQTIELMRNLHEIVRLGYPVMVAASRKGYVGYAYRIEGDDPKSRDDASAQEALLACELGASVVRTHNVAATVKALQELCPYVILSLGSNVALVAEPGEETEAKIAQINLSVAALCQLPDSKLIDMASFYESEPAYDTGQDSFVNTVVLLRTGIPPKELLDYLHAIEATLGRTRDESRPKGPRVIDVDIVDYQLYTAISKELTLPHPGALERDFVVKPLLEILPGHVLADGSRPGSIPEDKRIGHAEKI